jgi:hypothetical protein
VGAVPRGPLLFSRRPASQVEIPTPGPSIPAPPPDLHGRRLIQKIHMERVPLFLPSESEIVSGPDTYTVCPDIPGLYNRDGCWQGILV